MRSVGAVRGPPLLALPLLTVGALGTQAVWSLELAFAPPYLLSLGMSRAAMALVFLAGPISGLVVQPLVGAFSDACTSRWGRRRAFIAAGTAATSVSTLCLAWARPIAGAVGLGDAGARLVAIISIFGIDFCVNAINALDRALLLDLLPPSRQALAHAWSARLAGVGALLGYLVGQSDFSSSASGNADEAQLRGTAVITVFLLCSTHLVTCWAADEVPLRSYGGLPVKKQLQAAVSELRQAARWLPPPIRFIFFIQFWAWVAWFPYLTYTSAYLTSLVMLRPLPRTSVFADPADGTPTRTAAMVLATHAFLSLAAAIGLPPALQRWAPSALPSLWAASLALLSALLAGMAAGGVMGNSISVAIFVAMTGIAWAVTIWAPFAILGVLIQRTVPHTGVTSASRSAVVELPTRAVPAPQSAEREGLLDESERPARTSESEDSDAGDVLAFAPESQVHEPEHDQSGTVLGLHNVALVLPQFLVTLLSTLIFGLVDPNRSALPAHSDAQSATAADALAKASGIRAYAAIYFIGAVSTGYASLQCWKFARLHAGDLST